MVSASPLTRSSHHAGDDFAFRMFAEAFEKRAREIYGEVGVS
jgi:ribosome-associated toxin RatA of RatAB toxin-antitoxin module